MTAKRKSWKPSKKKLDIIRNELGNDYANLFHDKYRIAKERCCNKNNKDYNSYKNKFFFDDFSDFFDSCYDDFKKAILLYGKNISIDRIDGSKGYEKGNIRFVPMSLNLKNKDLVIKTKITDTKTGKSLSFDSFGEARNYLHESGAMFVALKKNRLYRKRYKVEEIKK